MLCFTINQVDLISLIYWDLTLFLFLQTTFCLKQAKLYVYIVNDSNFINRTAAYLKYIVILLLYKFIHYAELSSGNYYQTAYFPF